MENLEVLEQEQLENGFEQIVLSTDKEIEFAKKTNTLSLLDKGILIKIKRYTNKNINNLNSNKINQIKNEFNGFIDEFVESDVITFFQLSKGINKTNYADVMEKSQLNSGSKHLTLQENKTTQNLTELETQIINFKRVSENKKIYLVLEIESRNIEDKIIMALSKGVKNFIIRSGKYGDLMLWRAIIRNIHTKDGKVFVALTKRYDDNKVSYMEKFFRLGADFVFHQIPQGWEIKKTLHLNENFVYIEMSLDDAFSIYDNEVRKPFETKIRNANTLVYPFSRVRALNLANRIVSFLEPLEIF